MEQKLKAYCKQIFLTSFPLNKFVLFLLLSICTLLYQCKVENTRTTCLNECNLNRNLCFVLGQNQSANAFNIFSTCYVISSICESNCIQRTTSNTTTRSNSSSSRRSSSSSSNSGSGSSSSSSGNN